MEENKENKIVNILLIVGLLMFIIGIAWAATRKPDGTDANGVFDSEGGSEKPANTEGVEKPSGGSGGSVFSGPTTSKTYAQQPITLQYFKISEFDSNGKNEAGTGVQMRISTLQMLDKARQKLGTPLHINSGVRTKSWNAHVKGEKNSSHLMGYAADIATTDAAHQKKVLVALYDVGFRRFGIGKHYVHADNDPTKNTNKIWKYEGATITYNPLNA